VSSSGLQLRAGDWVEVRSKDEILRTLDRRGQLDKMPFMPEMFDYCGRRLRVVSSAHKTCDTTSGTGGRRMVDAVHLEGARCAGRDYEGCGAGCLIFWKMAWLKPVAGPDGAPLPDIKSASAPDRDVGCTVEDVKAGTIGERPTDGSGITYVCQATQATAASTELHWWDPRQYVEDYLSGNVGIRRMVDGFAYAISADLIRRTAKWPQVSEALMSAYDWIQARRRGIPFPRRRGTVPPGEKTPMSKLDVQPGELVRIKPYKEILATVDHNFRNRGMRFDAELVPFCGGTYKVRSRVSKIVDEKTGKIFKFKNEAVILDDVYCLSRYSDRRLFCPRAIYSYWREGWLERPNGTTAHASPAPVTATTTTPAPPAAS